MVGTDLLGGGHCVVHKNGHEVHWHSCVTSETYCTSLTLSLPIHKMGRTVPLIDSQ